MNDLDDSLLQHLKESNRAWTTHDLVERALDHFGKKVRDEYAVDMANNYVTGFELIYKNFLDEKKYEPAVIEDFSYLHTK